MNTEQPWMLDRMIEERREKLIVEAEHSRKPDSSPSRIDIRRALGGALVSAGQRIAGTTINEQGHTGQDRRLSSAG